LCKPRFHHNQPGLQPKSLDSMCLEVVRDIAVVYRREY